MFALISAGGIPKPDESLYTYTRGGNKALLNLCGKPMIQWVLDALSGSALIDHVFIVGLPLNSKLVCKHSLTLIENHGDMVENVRAGAEEILKQAPSTEIVLLISSDIPAITSEMIDWMVKIVESQSYDVFYSVVERKIMENRFPESKRTYSRLKDIELCGGDVHALRPSIAIRHNPLWDNILAARKNPLKQASLVGFDTLFYFITRQLELEKAAIFLSNKLGIKGKAVILPFAEMGMDVDKAFQYEIMVKDLCQNKRSND
jgi:GTP:adenosylcobinamide-phosphate guanylyltransferase